MHQEQAAEQKRLDTVVQKIDQQLLEAREAYAKAHSETRAVESNYIANTSINTVEIDDAMETNAEIQQQRNIVARVTETENIMAKTVDTLTLLRPNPYFGRVDIVEDNLPETLYIGLASLQDDQGDFLIYDWRAPISGVYYNGTLGKVSYSTPNGEQIVDLKKKRQFVISDAKITNMFDTNETVGDEMLQFALGQQNDEVMRNIVATIQKEQNQIIRDTTSDLLVVQGVAGSGKTSAILQRIAFLLFHAREALNSDQIVLFSPNRLFSSYIADVLPSLGERNMRQVTLAEFFSARLQGLTVQTLFDRYEQEQQVIGQASQNIREVLESADIVKFIQSYVDQIRTDDLHFVDIYYEDKVFFSAEELANYMSTLSVNYSMRERVDMVQKHFLQVLTDRIDRLQDADWVFEELDNLTDQEYQELLGDEDIEETMATENVDDVISLVAKRYLTKHWQVIDDALYNSFFLDIYEQYVAFLTYMGEQDTDHREWWTIKLDRFARQLEYHRIDLEDAAPLLFLRDALTGGGTNQAMSYVFVDEMQDYALSQLLYLKHAFPRAKFTVLGDSEQALFRAVETPQALLDKYAQAFVAKRPTLIKLNKAYRSTQEIMNFAKALLPDGEDIMTFTRHGEKPHLIQTTTKDVSAVLTNEVTRLRQKFQTVAILTKTATQSIKVVDALRNYPETVQLLHATDRSRMANVLVMPIYLAKGLEFDAVIGYDVSQGNYPDDQATGLLYTLASRAMHALSLVSVGRVSGLITRVNDTLEK
ncbi:RNA polymerase recycling motor HelD [Weissella paramesenteroides]|uniref:RNA polymerase recycling motor HelD n=1 Tax=Weissella paramesenteroides TaxID=1249 RepID=UPI002E7B37ED|nr:RNA polymerase recycling motor HelD [Weissella paramesenteroides]WPQ68286.1 RNA polymerase recycling motor HelD [Weissella paramesenteroides]